MAAFTFNIAKGRAVEFAHRINNNDPSNSVFVLVALKSSASHATLKDYDTLAAVLGDGDTDEITNSGYSRIVLDNTDSITVTVDDSGDLAVVDFPDQSFGSVDAGDDIDYLLLGYDSDSTGGSDSAIVPVTLSDFDISPNGGEVGVTVDTDGAFVASE